jgi:hypothetical protein
LRQHVADLRRVNHGAQHARTRQPGDFELLRLQHPVEILARNGQFGIDLVDEQPVIGGIAPIDHQPDQQRQHEQRRRQHQQQQSRTHRTAAQSGRKCHGAMLLQAP